MVRDFGAEVDCFEFMMQRDDGGCSPDPPPSATTHLTVWAKSCVPVSIKGIDAAPNLVPSGFLAMQGQ